MVERRGHKRYSGSGLTSRMVFCPQVTVLDISLGGALVEVTRRMNIGATCLLEIRKEDTALKVSSVVARSAISGSRRSEGGEIVPVYQAALEFKDLSEEKHLALLDIVREASAETRFEGMQFTVHSQSVPDYLFNYRVKNVGLDGMQVESDMKFGEDEDVTLDIYVEEHLPVEFKGRVTSCRKMQGDEQRYEVSFAFTEMTEEAKADIIRYIESVS